MKDDTYRFKVGSFECVVVLDGTNTYHHPGPVFFTNADSTELARELEPYGIDAANWDEYVSPYPSLVVYTGEHVVLIDTGGGGFAPTNGKLLENLRASHIQPQDFDTVILTHGHADHIGSNVTEDGDPSFPNARYVMSRPEWEFWYPEPDMSEWKIDQFRDLLVNAAKRNLNSLKDTMAQVEWGDEIVPGVHALDASGHTPGQMAVAVESEGKSLLHLSDAALFPVHISRTDWYALVDLAPETAMVNRISLLERAAADEAWVFGSHFPFPGLGKVSKENDIFIWNPVSAPPIRGN